MFYRFLGSRIEIPSWPLVLFPDQLWNSVVVKSLSAQFQRDCESTCSCIQVTFSFVQSVIRAVDVRCSLMVVIVFM